MRASGSRLRITHRAELRLCRHAAFKVRCPCSRADAISGYGARRCFISLSTPFARLKGGRADTPTIGLVILIWQIFVNLIRNVVSSGHCAHVSAHMAQRGRIMQSKIEGLGIDVIEEAKNSDDCRSRRRQRVVPLLKSGAAAACVFAVVTFAVAGFAMQTADTSRQGENPTTPSQEKSADMAESARENASGQTEKPLASVASAEENEPVAEDEAALAESGVSAAEGVASTHGREESYEARELSEAAAPSAVPEPSPADGGAAGSATSSHQHSWEAETKTVDHPAEYKDVVHEAVYEKKSWTKCNACSQDITGKVAEHLKVHAMAGESANYHTVEDKTLVSEAWTEYGVLVRKGYTEKVETGFEVCSSCGALRGIS